jgi:hypothetical protein
VRKKVVGKTRSGGFFDFMNQNACGRYGFTYLCEFYAEYIATNDYTSCRAAWLKIQSMADYYHARYVSKLTDGSVLNQIMQRGFMGSTLTDPLPATHPAWRYLAWCIHAETQTQA